VSDTSNWTETEMDYRAKAQFLDAVFSGMGLYDNMPQHVKDALARLERFAEERRAKRAEAGQ
jgi:hypothetical protein